MGVMGNDSEFVVNNRTRCQYRRVDPHMNHRTDKCAAKALPGSMYCASCLKLAMARVRMTVRKP